MSVIPSSFVKQPYEEISISLDFSKRLEDNSTISDHSVVITNNSSGEDVTDSLKAGSKVDGQSVVVGVKGGVSGTTYKITIKITTSMTLPDGEYQKFEGDIMMKIVEK